MLRFLARLSSSKAGVTAVEYALIAAFIAVAMSVGTKLVSPNLFATFRSVSEAGPVD